jgi:hypothetical protein
MNLYFVLCSSLELELVCEKDANNGINEVGEEGLGCGWLFFVFFLCVDVGVFGDGTSFATQRISGRDSKKLNIEFLHYLW